MSIFLSIVIFLFALSILILGHEFGHFLAARRSNVKVLEFAFGFPPRLFSWRRKGTRFSLNLVPLGGYVKLLGEEGESQDKDSFTQKTVVVRAKIIVAGVLSNLLIAFLLFWLSFMGGVIPLLPSPALSSEKTNQILITKVAENSAAFKAGLKSGDIILGFASGEAFSKFTRENRGKEINLDIKREGQEFSLNARLGEEEEGPLGVFIYPLVLVKLKPLLALKAAFWQLKDLMVLTFQFMGRFLAQLFQKGQLSAEVGGPIAIFIVLKESLRFGWTMVLETIGLISATLALINILPFPALDGGRLSVVLAEGLARRKVLPPHIENLIHSLGFILLLLLLVAVTIKDVVRFVVK
ncbi:site-2 protease family protein [Candidatus Berkelbacteria bacterium]|nr:site-2 protease family protein [Candidatus Berkelbacteria bacterium]